MTQRFNILPGVAVNRDEVLCSLKATGRYSSGAPRQRGPAPKPRQLTPIELFGNYVDAKIHGHEKEFLKSLSLDQFMTLCASLERSKS